jgi:hypothetical protein
MNDSIWNYVDFSKYDDSLEFKGACYTCEPVAMLNLELDNQNKDLLAALDLATARLLSACNPDIFTDLMESAAIAKELRLTFFGVDNGKQQEINILH